MIVCSALTCSVSSMRRFRGATDASKSSRPSKSPWRIDIPRSSSVVRIVRRMSSIPTVFSRENGKMMSANRIVGAMNVSWAGLTKRSYCWSTEATERPRSRTSRRSRRPRRKSESVSTKIRRSRRSRKASKCRAKSPSTMMTSAP
eukprot:Amastigsp_a340841_69.p5 type:complete len:145 gc:universal Amastigsp_a340841_69:902-1336(+)